MALAVAPAHADTIDINGVTRTFIVQPPATKPAPLVIVLHGKTQRGADMVMRTAWPLIAKRDGFAVVYPDGLNNAWADSRPEERRALRGPPEGTGDVAFITGLIEKLVANGVADARRVYVTGISNGAAMTMTLVCARADLFAAAASVIMNLTDESAGACHPSRPTPMLIMNGTVDPLVPYEGGRGSSYFAADGFWSTAKTLAFWARSMAARRPMRRRPILTTRTSQTSPRSRAFPRAARRGTTSCSIASTMAAIACPECFRTRTSRKSRTGCSGLRTATSTAPTRSGRSSVGFRNAALRPCGVAVCWAPR